MLDAILILDFGSQYTQLIARRLREAQVYCEIHPFNVSVEKIKSLKPKGLVFSGSPASVYEENAPRPAREILDLGLPILGICYGLHIISDMLGGEVVKAEEKEFGPAELRILHPSPLFTGMGTQLKIWMSHGDHLVKIPPGFIHTASAWNTKFAAVEDPERKIYLVQFHPEVTHTPEGARIMRNFAFNISKVQAKWTPEYFIEYAMEKIHRTVGTNKVICALSGGVDSSVTALLVNRAVGENAHLIFVDNGLLRFEDRKVIEKSLISELGLKVKLVNAEKRFLEALNGVTEPERKRKIIGETFIRVFEDEAKDWSDAKFLAQGTLYPDVIESVSVKGPSVTIKSHHNVGGLPEAMGLELVEPLRELFKDEVRVVGRILGLPEAVVQRHPFPGPGLAVRILGEITRERLEILRKADDIFISELRSSGWYGKVSQAFCVLLPVKSVGVMGDARTYENVLALRSVNTEDFMTAAWSHLPFELLGRVSNRIINEVKGINRVVYDVSTKPPATVEWE
jgi:GMP synthase (glutamine-hydrolysing)